MITGKNMFRKGKATLYGIIFISEGYVFYFFLSMMVIIEFAFQEMI